MQALLNKRGNVVICMPLSLTADRSDVRVPVGPSTALSKEVISFSSGTGQETFQALSCIVMTEKYAIRPME